MAVEREEQRKGEANLRPLTLALVFGAGVLIGWMVLGWMVFPVQWRNAKPSDLAPGYQVDYLAMVADSYVENRDRELARQRLANIDPKRVQEVADYLADQQLTEQAHVLRELAQAPGAPATPGATLAVPTTQPGQTQVQVPATTTTLGQRLRFVGGVILLAVLLIIGTVAGMAWFAGGGRERIRGTGVEEPRIRAAPSWVFHEATLGYPSPAGFVAGQAGYKESFQIKDQFHEVLGECGLKVAEALGAVPGDRVPALEVWLYDKEDGRTVSVTLLSEHAFRDRSFFAQPPGGQAERAGQKLLHLETANLRLEAEILDVSYLEAVGELPPNAYFARVDVNLTPTAREQGSEGSWPPSGTPA